MYTPNTCHLCATHSVTHPFIVIIHMRRFRVDRDVLPLPHWVFALVFACMLSSMMVGGGVLRGTIDETQLHTVCVFLLGTVLAAWVVTAPYCQVIVTNALETCSDGAQRSAGCRDCDIIATVGVERERRNLLGC